MSLQEAIGYGWRAVIHPDDLDSLFECWQWMMRAGSAGEYEARMRRSEGQYRWVLFCGAPLLDSTGSVSKWFGVNIDIDDRKGAEAALRRTEAALSRSSQLATLGEPTAAIAHEVNQPLAAVVANAEAGLQWLDREKPNLDGVHQALQRIVQDGSDAGEIINSLHALFRRAARTTAEHRIQELVTDVLKLVEHEMSRRRVSVDLALGGDLPAVLCGRLQIQQVMLNLVVNAMNALDPALHAEKTIRAFANWDGAESIVLGIRDNGAGVQDPDGLFETFFNQGKRPGMGLAISGSIVEAHCGRLWLEPTDGPGSMFCFRLPVKRASTSADPLLEGVA